MKPKPIFRAAWSAAACLLAACSPYDDTALWNAVEDHEQRLSALEAWQTQVNNNIASLQELLSTTDYITAVTPVMQDGQEVGYTIEFFSTPTPSPFTTVRRVKRVTKVSKVKKATRVKKG